MRRRSERRVGRAVEWGRLLCCAKNAFQLPLLFDFPLDMARVPADVNRLTNQTLVHSYEREWGRH